MTKKAFMAKAKKKGIKVYKNNIKNAKPLDEVCGSLSFKNTTSCSRLINCR